MSKKKHKNLISNYWKVATISEAVIILCLILEIIFG